MNPCPECGEPPGDIVAHTATQNVVLIPKCGHAIPVETYGNVECVDAAWNRLTARGAA